MGGLSPAAGEPFRDPRGFPPVETEEAPFSTALRVPIPHPLQTP